MWVSNSFSPPQILISELWGGALELIFSQALHADGLNQALEPTALRTHGSFQAHVLRVYDQGSAAQSDLYLHEY